MHWRTVLNQLFNDVSLLIHLDRIDPAVAPFEVELLYRIAERRTHLRDASGQDVRKTNQHGRPHPASLEFFDERHQVDAGAFVSKRQDFDGSAIIHAKKAVTPTVEAVQLDAVLESPVFHRKILRCDRNVSILACS